MEDTYQGNVNQGPEATAAANGMASVPTGEGEATTPQHAPEKRKRASAKKYKPFEEAKQFAHGLNLKSRKEWREYVKGKRDESATKPDDIPAHPDGIYKTKGWQGWRNWLGTEKPARENLN